MAAEDVRPIWQLIEEAAGELPAPILAQDLVEWFETRHPDVAIPTLRAQLAAVTGNSRTYLNHPVYSQRPPILWRIRRGEYEAYDRERHGEPRAADEELEERELLDDRRAPVWQLLHQAAQELPPPFTAQAIVDWFAQYYPDVPVPTVRTQMSDWAGNSPGYLFNPTYNRRPPILWRVARGVYEPYDPDRHGEIVPPDARDGTTDDVVDAAQEFLLEQYLEQFLSDNWERVDFGRDLELWSPDGRPPRQFDASPAGRIDFLCRDRGTGALVVVELKRGTPSDAVVGQALRYMAWVKAELAQADQAVEGIIVVGEADERLLYSVSVVPQLCVMNYRIDFRLELADARR